MITAEKVEALRANGARMQWFMSFWCNYKCNFCGVDVYSRKPAKGPSDRHAFDIHPPQIWLGAFKRHFAEKNLSLTITGGEPFLDRASFLPLLDGLSHLPNFTITIHTNGSWNPDYFARVDKSRIFLEVSFHPSQTKFDAFRQRLLKIRDCGFNVSHTHIVLAPEHLDVAESSYLQLRADGFTAHLNSMAPTGVYENVPGPNPRQMELLQQHAGPRNVYFGILRPNVKGLDCYHPSVAYRMLHDGSIGISCFENYPANFLKHPLPELAPYPAKCPHDICHGCPDMVRSIPALDINNDQEPALLDARNFGNDYAEFHKQKQTDPEALKHALEKWTIPGKGNAYTLFKEWSEAAPKPKVKFDVPLEAIASAQPVPNVPMFGYIDKLQGDVYTGRATDRLFISGWAASTRTEFPVEEVRIIAGGKLCASFKHFYPRPEVATIFNRSEFFETGYRGLVFLPILKPGMHPLTAIARDTSGMEQELHSLQLHITE